MDSNQSEVVFEFPSILRIYKDGRQERLRNDIFIPPSLDPSTGVSSKDVVLQQETGLSARLYLPKDVVDSNKKIPLVIYFHGGGFVIERASSPSYHTYLNSLVSEANVVAVSVDYRRAPEHPVPICYEDSWTALQWIVSQSKEEEWFKKYVDFDKVFMAGDSAGANIVQNMAIRAGVDELKGLKISGIVLIHPYFIGFEIDNPGLEFIGKLWSATCPSTIGSDDPFINPVKHPDFSRLGCKRVLVCVAEKDEILKERARIYYEELRKSEWDGVVEFVEAQEEGHVFHLEKPTCEKAVDMMKCVVNFIHTSE